VRFHPIQRKYRQYFFNDVLMHKYNEEITKLDKAKYDLNHKLFLLSPLYALYFLSLMYKRYLYYLGNEIRDERSKKLRAGKLRPDGDMAKPNKFSFISDANINDENREILGGVELGEYVYKKIVSLNNLLRRLIHTAMKPRTEIAKDKFQEYENIFKEVFYLFYSMNFDYTNTNQDWLDDNVSKINTLEELYKRMALGISNLSQPTIDHINKLNGHIQTLENIADLIEGEGR
jgi:hypothetical protein